MHLVFIASEVRFTFPVTCLHLVVFWVLYPAAASTKLDSMENFSKSRVPSSLASCLHLYSHLNTHKHTHTTTTSQIHINHQSETCTYWHSHNTFPSNTHTYSCILRHVHVLWMIFLMCTPTLHQSTSWAASQQDFLWHHQLSLSTCKLRMKALTVVFGFIRVSLESFIHVTHAHFCVGGGFSGSRTDLIRRWRKERCLR